MSRVDIRRIALEAASLVKPQPKAKVADEQPALLRQRSAYL
jgi:hypothetical protein